MSSFNLELEHRRLKELSADVSVEEKAASIRDNLQAELAERTRMHNPFTLVVDGNTIEAQGYEHRGDLSNSFRRSIKEAQDNDLDEKAKRFTLENHGYGEAKKYFFSLPYYSTVMLLSPPPSTPIEGYPGYSLSYFYYVLPGESKDKRTIKALSFIHDFDLDEQTWLISAFGKNALATEDSILSTPVYQLGYGSDTQSFKAMWEKMGEVYKKKKRNFAFPSFESVESFLLYGQDLWKQKYQDLSVMTEEIAKMIVQGASEKELASKYRIMLNLADKCMRHIDVTPVMHQEVEINEEQTFTIFDAYRDLDYAPRRTVTSCGISDGMEQMGGMISVVRKAAVGTPVGAVVTATFEVQQTSSDEFYSFNTYAPCTGCIKERDDHEKKMVGPCFLCPEHDEKAKDGRLKNN